MADAVALRIDVAKIFSRQSCLGQRSARPFRQYGDLAAKFVAGGEVVLVLAVLCRSPCPRL